MLLFQQDTGGLDVGGRFTGRTVHARVHAFVHWRGMWSRRGFALKIMRAERTAVRARLRKTSDIFYRKAEFGSSLEANAAFSWFRALTASARKALLHLERRRNIEPESGDRRFSPPDWPRCAGEFNTANAKTGASIALAHFHAVIVMLGLGRVAIFHIGPHR